MKIDEHVALSRFTTLGTGGPARAFARPETLEELQDALRFSQERGLRVATIGLGSNLLVSDVGFDGLALKLAGALARVDVEGERLVAGGGAPNAVSLHRARRSVDRPDPAYWRASPHGRHRRGPVRASLRHHDG